MEKTIQDKLNITLILLVILSFILGAWGWYWHYINAGAKIDILDAAYFSIQLFVLESSYKSDDISIALNIARFLSPFLLATAIINYVVSYAKKRGKLLFIKLRIKNHFIICGISNKAVHLINNIQKNDSSKIVVIEQNPDHEEIINLEKDGVAVITGNARDTGILKAANIEKASYLISLTDDDETNIDIGIKAQDFQNRGEELKVLLHLTNYYNLRIFRDYQESPDDNLDYHAFNIYEKAAARIVDAFCPDKYINVKTADDPQVHILVYGLTKAGEYLIIQAAHMYHFANLKKLKVTIVDNEIRNKIARFYLYYPRISEVLDIQLIDEHAFLTYETDHDLDDVSVCFITSEDDSECLDAALKARQFFYKQKKRLVLPVIVALFPDKTTVYTLFKNVYAVAEFANINLIKINDFCIKKYIIDDHEVCDLLAKHIDKDFMIKEGMSEKDVDNKWNRYTDAEKDWNRYPARHFEIKLRAAGAMIVDVNNAQDVAELDLNSVDVRTKELLARMEHNRWIAEKLITGYVPGEYMEDKRLEKEIKRKLKIHPALQPWKDLEQSEQDKDFYAFNNVKDILAKANKKIVPLVNN